VIHVVVLAVILETAYLSSFHFLGKNSIESFKYDVVMYIEFAKGACFLISLNFEK
jgi:hypothetical protein